MVIPWNEGGGVVPKNWKCKGCCVPYTYKSVGHGLEDTDVAHDSAPLWVYLQALWYNKNRLLDNIKEIIWAVRSVQKGRTFKEFSARVWTIEYKPSKYITAVLLRYMYYSQDET